MNDMANLRSIWILTLVMLIIVISCNKDEGHDPGVNYDIEINENDSKILKNNDFKNQVLADLSEKEKKYKDIELLNKRYGDIHWELSRLKQSEGSPVLITPIFKKNSKRTEAIILSIQNHDGIKYFVGSAKEIDKYIKGKDWKSEFFNLQVLITECYIFDLQVFGIDDEVYKSWINKNLLTKSKYKSEKACATATICYDACYYTERIDPKNEKSCKFICYTGTICQDRAIDSGSGTIGGDIESTPTFDLSGSGGSGGYLPGSFDNPEYYPSDYKLYISDKYLESPESIPRLGMMGYRVGKRLYAIYKKVGGDKTKFKNALEAQDFGDLIGITDDLLALFGPNVPPLQRVEATISLLTGVKLSSSQKQKLLDAVSNWSNEEKGTYFGQFSGGSVVHLFYEGKGSFKRMTESLRDLAKKHNLKIEQMGWKGADTDDIDTFRNIDRSSFDRAAFKEEAIEMHLSGWKLTNSTSLKPSNMLNQIKSPGVNYILQDGF